MPESDAISLNYQMAGYEDSLVINNLGTLFFRNFKLLCIHSGTLYNFHLVQALAKDYKIERLGLKIPIFQWLDSLCNGGFDGFNALLPHQYQVGRLEW